MKKVYIISSSIRSGSNSEMLAKEFEKGTVESGNQVTFLSLKDFDLKFCKGCLACQKLGKCIIKDDMAKIIDEISESDVLVFATPVYYYEMSGQLKTFLDRLNPLYGKDNQFNEIYLLGACADNSRDAFDRVINGVGGWIDCFDGVNLKDTLLATGTNDVNSISEKDKKTAYDMGKNV